MFSEWFTFSVRQSPKVDFSEMVKCPNSKSTSILKYSTNSGNEFLNIILHGSIRKAITNKNIQVLI